MADGGFGYVCTKLQEKWHPGVFWLKVSGGMATSYSKWAWGSVISETEESLRKEEQSSFFLFIFWNGVAVAIFNIAGDVCKKKISCTSGWSRQSAKDSRNKLGFLHNAMRGMYFCNVAGRDDISESPLLFLLVWFFFFFFKRLKDFCLTVRFVRGCRSSSPLGGLGTLLSDSAVDLN